MTYVPADFGPGKSGPQILWYRWRLAVHGFLSTTPRALMEWSQADAADTQRLQLAQGWKGTQPGGGADGLPGLKTLAVVTGDPKPPAAGVVEMSKFKRTLATGEPGHPTEQYPLVDTTGPVTFRAPVNGVTTSGSSYARDELREMVPKVWSSSDGKHHRMTGVCRVVEIPGRKTDYLPGVVIAQIHDADDDVIIILVDMLGRVILEEGLGKDNGSKKYELFTGYKLGDPLSYVIDAHASVIDVTVNGRHVPIAKSPVDAYFKAGVYNRGNTSNATGAGSVAYDALATRHAA